MCTDITYKFLRLLFALAVVVAMPVSARSDSSVDKIEQLLKKENKVYLVVDFSERMMTLKQSGTVLREYAFEMTEDSAEADRLVRESAERDSAGTAIEHVSLLTATATVPQVELEIIQEETHLGEEQIQKYLPGKFVIVLNDGSCLRLETNIVPDKKFHLQIINDYFRRTMMLFSGKETFHFRMSPEDAMSLYGAARNYPKVMFKR